MEEPCWPSQTPPWPLKTQPRSENRTRRTPGRALGTVGVSPCPVVSARGVWRKLRHEPLMLDLGRLALCCAERKVSYSVLWLEGAKVIGERPSEPRKSVMTCCANSDT